MRIVLDTNILVSGLLSPFGPPGDIVRLITTGTVRVCYDARILGEYRQVLLRPAFSFSQVQIESVLAQLEADGDLVTARPLSEGPPDPDDEIFLAVAIASQAHCLVTGNLRHYPASRRQGVQVVSPRNFLELYREMAGFDDL